ncbi:hypothetical protein GKE82_01550 [Conexibacter sp. W3-3-2]|uniref:PsbP C-terminal domain-containing protein n=1 Tax=Paraconexibacter algicola TaxID=2133960 RepID=A0A2T4UC69_9ACTN|nr:MULTISPECIES: hypothetical protein [Solirubrobacterales]MTD43023.1 hypothetical protein [Conexibacter sp. W3-3-2]PTL54792.1 hypothetical protein C7Y72_19560 [Paraconexibacter algicola]
MSRPLPLFAVLALLAVPVAGCGNERTPVPEVGAPTQRLGDNPISDPRAGFSLVAPAGWTVAAGAAPVVSTISSGTAIVSILRYPRTEPLPKDREALDRALNDLLAAAKARDASFMPIKSARAKLDGHPALEIRATQTVAGVPRTVRSVHAYAFGAEVVVDMIAPNDSFRQVDATFFRPLLRSMKLRAPTA